MRREGGLLQAQVPRRLVAKGRVCPSERTWTWLLRDSVSCIPCKTCQHNEFALSCPLSLTDQSSSNGRGSLGADTQKVGDWEVEVVTVSTDYSLSLCLNHDFDLQ